jgi:hypothetical protein
MGFAISLWVISYRQRSPEKIASLNLFNQSCVRFTTAS